MGYVEFSCSAGFNTQPPEGGCLMPQEIAVQAVVSTHSHPKVAALRARKPLKTSLFQHTATRRWLRRGCPALCRRGCFNTQPPEGGCSPTPSTKPCESCFNTQPPEGGCEGCAKERKTPFWFQHTATRRWLLRRAYHGIRCAAVSTHSHPKVAA